mmetsp:Transcript_100655/g.194431  ORF Transcript_100655/g.194431 Transcript_100655/m.194431 type:complete len:87 (-) Transcript_100655:140-400(-)
MVAAHEIRREKLLLERSQRAWEQLQEARALQERPLVRSGAATLAATPNAHRYPQHRRQLKHQVRHGDGRAHMLSRVFLNGQWTYAP